MKKIILSGIVIVSLLAMAGPVFAVKPSTNLAAAQKVDWNLSGAVMPVPPYGSGDIFGSDTASKLIVNQPNGNTEVTITGAMNGLNPDTTYTVYLSKAYTPYVYTGWSVLGAWVLRFNLGGNYDHDIVINVQNDGTFSGTGGYPASGPPYSITETVTGTIDVMTGAITMHSVYNNGYWYDAIGTIASDGTMSGTWGNTGQGYGHSWYSISGHAVKTNTGNTGWPGLFTSTVQPFTFTTDEFGVGSWHLNLRDENFPASGTFSLSVWINGGGRTILVSDTFEVVVVK
jgi:hypothetical protein